MAPIVPDGGLQGLVGFLSTCPVILGTLRHWLPKLPKADLAAWQLHNGFVQRCLGCLEGIFYGVPRKLVLGSR